MRDANAPAPSPPTPPAKPQWDLAGLVVQSPVGRMKLPTIDIPVLEDDLFIEGDTDVTTIQYQPVDLRPYDFLDLPELAIIGTSGALANDVDVTWSVTAKSHDGIANGNLVLRAADTVVRPVADRMLELLARQ